MQPRQSLKQRAAIGALKGCQICVLWDKLLSGPHLSAREAEVALLSFSLFLLFENVSVGFRNKKKVYHILLAVYHYALVFAEGLRNEPTYSPMKPNTNAKTMYRAVTRNSIIVS